MNNTSFEYFISRGRMRLASARERFASQTIPVTESGCLLWIGAIVTNGLRYGKLKLNGKTMLAHRVAWELEYGYIKNGMNVCHKCDTPQCVRIEHLFLGTQMENMKDKINKHRHRGARPGELHHLSILKEDDVRQIRNSNQSRTELAAYFGVSDQTIYQIKSGRRWKCVA